jgi:hypothetical protein
MNRIRIDLEIWIRIRIETNANPATLIILIIISNSINYLDRALRPPASTGPISVIIFPSFFRNFIARSTEKPSGAHRTATGTRQQ